MVTRRNSLFLRKGIDSLFRHFEKEFKTHNRIEVSKSALLHNFDLLSAQTKQQIIPVLKANAYGHGIEQVTRILKARHMPYIAVDGYFEALAIRRVSSQSVLVMGAILPQNYVHMTYDNFAFVVHDKVAIQALGNTGKPIKLHLEFNTGMNRYGARPESAAELTKFILNYKNLTLEGVMSHLADSGGDDPSTVDEAVCMFDRCVEAVRTTGGNPTLLHIAQSAGSLKAKSKYANAIRLGVALYGSNPLERNHTLYKRLHDIRPAMQLVSTITQIIDLKKGEKVSYGYTYTAPKAMRIGVIPLGYYEGMNRALSNKGVVKIGSQYAPIVGYVCMNHTMVSLEGIQAAEGDEVLVYSNNPADQNSIDSIAQKHDLFNYNLLTSLNETIRRVIVD